MGLFTGWKSKKILSAISKNLDKLDSTVAKLENQRMTFTFVMKAFFEYVLNSIISPVTVILR